MNTLNQPNPVPEVIANWPANTSLKQASPTPDAPLEAEANKKSSVSVSSLAQQLSEAAQRSAEREANLTRQELAQKGQALLKVFTGDSYYDHKKTHDAQVPDTDDPAHLARARQATAFLNDRNKPNPFKGLSQEQLALITYDESGTFTVNERHAAWSEAYAQDQVQRRILCKKMEDEYNRTGKVANTLLDVYKHYQSLPSIERAVQIPAVYEDQLLARINAGANFQTRQELWFLNAELGWNLSLPELGN
ncbi:hypothetical protein [Alcaligenes faecalis]|uniref:hypothetical protein n=1 Tax=Alcaligenes faecalis TaxID=511 RepID=UPI001C82AF98|nr:hypothetical protein [Alcaligenes faecalis]MBX6964371.1 hypothetical protein [Providencia rettgeri]MBX7032457.1 hypothetical protein [Alcaligenes faecalis]